MPGVQGPLLQHLSERKMLWQKNLSLDVVRLVSIITFGWLDECWSGRTWAGGCIYKEVCGVFIPCRAKAQKWDYVAAQSVHSGRYLAGEINFSHSFQRKFLKPKACAADRLMICVSQSRLWQGCVLRPPLFIFMMVI